MAVPKLIGSTPDFLQDLARQMGPMQAMAFDVDGTLADSSSQVRPQTIDAISRLSRAGVQPVIVTGRIFPAAAKVLHDAGCPGIVIANNGAIVGDGRTDEIIYRAPMPAELSHALVETGREYGLSITLFLLRGMMSDQDDFSARFLKDANEGIPVEIGDIDAVEPDDIFKVMYAHPEARYLDEIGPALTEKFPDLQRSLDNYFEIVGPGEGKKKALHKTIEIHEWDPAKMAGFGDGGNDVHWMPEVGWPIAVENARPEVAAIARAQIGHHDDDAVAEFIDAYLEVFG